MPLHQKQLLLLAVLLLIVGAGLFAYMRGPARLIARPAEGSQVGLGMLDTCITGYTQEDVDRRLKAWSPDQIATYRMVHLGPDMVFPWVYSGFFFVAVLLLFGRAFPQRVLWPALVVLPVLTVAADYAENYLISFVILPDGLPSDAATVAWASRVTVAKWLLIAFDIVVLVVGVVLCIRRRRRAADIGNTPGGSLTN